MRKLIVVLMAVAVTIGLSEGAEAEQIATQTDLQGVLGGPGTIETFSNYVLGAGAATPIGCTAVTSGSICGSQGPGLIAPGITISAATSLQWNNSGYFGLPSEELSATSSTLTISFTIPVEAFGVDLNDYSGYDATATATIYGPDDTTVIGSVTGISLSGTDSIFVGWEDAGGIGMITLSSTNSWSPLIDNLEFPTVAEPEPASLALVGSGVLFLGWIRRRGLAGPVGGR